MHVYAEPETRRASGRARTAKTATNILGTPPGGPVWAARPTDGARCGVRMNARPAAAILGPVRKTRNEGQGAAFRLPLPGLVL